MNPLSSESQLTTTVNSRALGFTVVATGNVANVDVCAYQITGWRDGRPLWLPKRTSSSPWFVPVTELGEAERYLHGNVKFDGCSNWHFDEQDHTMLHGCSRADLVNIGRLLALCWDTANRLMDKAS